MNRNRSRSAARVGNARTSARRLTDKVIEGAWLAGVVLVPLLFNPRNYFSFFNDPKYLVLHLIALVIVTAWIWEWALNARTPNRLSVARVVDWIGRRPERWAVISTGALVLVALISTALSPVWLVSLWGRDFTDLGYELYSFLATLVVFFALAFRLRTRVQVRRLMLTLAGTGTLAALYGVLQRFGWDPLGPGENAGRVFATFGNPILLGSFLVMTAVITVSAVLAEDRDRKYVWLIGGAVALGLQLAALWFAGSRGPWIGYAAGAVAFPLIGYLWLDRRTLVRSLGLVAAGVAVALVIGFLRGADGGDERSLADLGSIFDGSEGGSIGGRGPIWESALELSVERSWVPEEAAATGVLRSLVGYGPEMFFYAYPLAVDVDQSESVAQHAHNLPLQILMELGLLGLISFIVLGLFAVYAAIRLLNTGRRSGDQAGWAPLVVVGLLAALVGRATEQMAGVARISDMLIFWALMGLLIAVVEIARREHRADPVPEVRQQKGRERERPGVSFLLPRNVIVVLAIGVTILSVGLLYFRDVRTLQASAMAQDAVVLREAGRPNEALDKYQRAVELNPAVESYHLSVNDLFREAAGLAETAGDVNLAVVGWEGAIDAAKNYEDRNLNAFDTQGRLGQAESRLAALGRDDLLAIAGERYVRMADARPTYPLVLTETAQGLLAVGDDAGGLFYADQALAFETRDFPNPKAWWFRGVALENLGELEEAAESYETAVERAPESEEARKSHLRLAVVYERLGDVERAEQERLLAETF
jgi:tetratricopeptide (TPR) repeat protein